MIIRVVVADDHPVYREGLAHYWRDDPQIDVISTVGDGLEAVKEIRRLEPDVAVVDLRLPGIDGIEILEQLREVELATRVLILTAYVDSVTVYRALGAGAAGFLEKASSFDEITDAVLSAAGGGVVIPPAIGGVLAQGMRVRADDDQRPALSQREIEVLKLAADGASAQQISSTLHLSITTVRTHFAHIYQKLDVSDRAAAVARAIRQGILN